MYRQMGGHPRQISSTTSTHYLYTSYVLFVCCIFFVCIVLLFVHWIGLCIACVLCGYCGTFICFHLYYILFIYLEILSVLSEVVYPSTSTTAEVCMYILLSVHTWVLIVVCIPLSCPRLSKPCPTYVHM